MRRSCRRRDGEPSDGRHVAEGEVVDEAEPLPPNILAQIQQNLYLPIQLPDGEALARLKGQDPKAYAMWLREIKRDRKHQRFMESARFKMPLRVLQSGQIAALLALVVVAVIAMYALHLDEPWVAGLVGALDVVGILAVFVGSGSDD